MAFFAASCDDVETNRKFAEHLGLDFPILSDPDRRVATAYGVVTPDRKYPARWTFYISAEGTIKAIDRDVDPTTAGAELAKKLAELGM